MIEVVATIFKYDSDLLNNHRVVKTLNSFIATIFNKPRMFNLYLIEHCQLNQRPHYWI